MRREKIKEKKRKWGQKEMNERKKRMRLEGKELNKKKNEMRRERINEKKENEIRSEGMREKKKNEIRREGMKEKIKRDWKSWTGSNRKGWDLIERKREWVEESKKEVKE